jgi:hypothetical protein
MCRGSDQLELRHALREQIGVGPSELMQLPVSVYADAARLEAWW